MPNADAGPRRRLTDAQIKKACQWGLLEMDDTPRRYFHDKVVVSRKAHVCFNCAGPIHPGEHCRSMKLLFSDESTFWIQRVCADCCACGDDFEAFCERYQMHAKPIPSPPKEPPMPDANEKCPQKAPRQCPDCGSHVEGVERHGDGLPNPSNRVTVTRYSCLKAHREYDDGASTFSGQPQTCLVLERDALRAAVARLEEELAEANSYGERIRRARDEMHEAHDVAEAQAVASRARAADAESALAGSVPKPVALRAMDSMYGHGHAFGNSSPESQPNNEGYEKLRNHSLDMALAEHSAPRAPATESPSTAKWSDR